MRRLLHAIHAMLKQPNTLRQPALLHTHRNGCRL